jgi:hypothetical protein
MEAGLELDRLIARKVMGVKDEEAWLNLLCPHYSTDIAAAFEIPKKLDGQWTITGQHGIGWSVEFVEASMREDRWENPFKASAETISHAISLAALKAVGAL